MGNHELSVQVAAHGHRHMEDILRVARLLEAVQEDEKFRPRGHKPSTQACFVADERDHLPDTKQLVKDVLTQLSRDVKSGQSVRKRPPTPGPRRVRSTDRKDTKPSANSSSCTGKGGVADLLLQKDGPVVEMGQCSVIIVKDMAISVRTVHLRTSTRYGPTGYLSG